MGNMGMGKNLRKVIIYDIIILFSCIFKIRYVLGI